MQVRAKTTGFFDLRGDKHPREIKPGTVFEVPDNTKLGRWLEKVDPAKSVADKPVESEQKTGPKAGQKPAAQTPI